MSNRRQQIQAEIDEALDIARDLGPGFDALENEWVGTHRDRHTLHPDDPDREAWDHEARYER